MSWVLLVLAGLLEIGWAIGLKLSEGFSRPIPSILTILAMVLSMFLLGVSVKELPIGTAYAIWVGIGTFGAGILGILIFHEPVSPLRIASLAFIVVGIVGMKLSSG